ncbi:hypothetical protein TIFTF001_038127 [Ficus carica]|uniref:Uncharacterized protein n=1 Tax=Ficus carica TaxID=3494 RepID=A0AA88E6N8_FICCA|nr:hypothetical protein TIFTF001_038127 [Ficus carica]
MYKEEGEEGEAKENEENKDENGKGKEEEKKDEAAKEKEEEKKDEQAKGEEKETNDEEAAMKQDNEERKDEEAAKEQENINDQIPKQKRSKHSRLGKKRFGPVIESGSATLAPTKMVKVNALPRGLSDEPHKENLEQFRVWIKKELLKKPPQGKRPAIAKYETLDKPHDLESMVVENKSWFYELATSPVWLWDEHINIALYYLRKKIMHFPELLQRKVLAKLDLLNWTIAVYDSLNSESPHNEKFEKH